MEDNFSFIHFVAIIEVDWFSILLVRFHQCAAENSFLPLFRILVDFNFSTSHFIDFVVFGIVFVVAIVDFVSARVSSCASLAIIMLRLFTNDLDGTDGPSKYWTDAMQP